jgi:hypothetical protein
MDFSDQQYRRFTDSVLIYLGATKRLNCEDLSQKIMKLAELRKKCEWYLNWYPLYPLPLKVLFDVWWQEILIMEASIGVCGDVFVK